MLAINREPIKPYTCGHSRKFMRFLLDLIEAEKGRLHWLQHSRISHDSNTVLTCSLCYCNFLFTQQPRRATDLNDNAPAEEEPPNMFVAMVATIQKEVHKVWIKHKKQFWWAVLVLIVIGYFVYFGLAMKHEFGSEESVRLLWVTCTVVFFFLIWLIGKLFGKKISDAFKPCAEYLEKHNSKISW